MDELKAFLDAKKLPGRLLFAKVWGSRSHNTEKEDSDWDFSGVYMVDTRDFLGMTKVEETLAKEGDEKPDFAFHEVGKFCNLLLVGNPGILEMLYTEKMCTTSPEWLALKANRQLFLSKSAVNQYVGYAEGQLKRLRNGNCLHTKGCGYNEKWAYHLSRLLFDAERIVFSPASGPIVWKEDGPERDYLMNIRHGNVSREEVEKKAELSIARIKEGLERSKLPETGSKEFLEDWLVDLRLNHLYTELKVKHFESWH